jgi:hypothetical protein
VVGLNGGGRVVIYMAISSSLKLIYASAPTTTRYIETLTFSHSKFGRAYYLTNDTRPWRFLLESGAQVTFAPVPFKIVLPAVDKSGQQDMALTLANIGRELVDPLELAITDPSEPIRCTYRVYLDREGTEQQNNPAMSLVVTGAQMTRDSVSATATRMDVLNRAFPYNMYRYDIFPGLRR